MSAFAMRRHPEELLCFQHHSLHDEKYPGSVLLVLIHADFVSFIKGLQQTSCVPLLVSCPLTRQVSVLSPLPHIQRKPRI